MAILFGCITTTFLLAQDYASMLISITV